MITIGNYFAKAKELANQKLPERLEKGYVFTSNATDNHRHWQNYTDNLEIRTKINRYLELLNEHFKSQKQDYTGADAKPFAKDLIRGYVKRGDSLASLENKNLGAANSEYFAEIDKKNIRVTKIKDTPVNFSFSIKNIYDELRHELFKTKTKETGSKQTPNKKAPKKPRETKNETEKAPRINYENSKPFERIAEDIKFIKRFISLHQKIKTKAQILNFINALQRAILEKRIRKTCTYAQEIMQIQRQLLMAHKTMKDNQQVIIGKTTLQKFAEIVGTARIRTSTQYLKRFVSIQGKNITKDKAAHLSAIIQTAIEKGTIPSSDPYYQSTLQITKSLNEFVKIAKAGETLQIHYQALNGLESSIGCNWKCDCDKESKAKNAALNGLENANAIPKAMTPEQVRNQKFDVVPIGQKWRNLLGDICFPTSFFIAGLGGGGKSSFALLFSQHLNQIGYNILYIAGEQYNTPPFTKLLNELDIKGNSNFQIVGELGALKLSDFDLIVFDTKDSLEMDVAKFLELKQEFQNQSFMIISHSNKDGDYRGDGRWRNVVDVMINSENGRIFTGVDKNRWGGRGEMLIFDHTSQYIFKKDEA